MVVLRLTSHSMLHQIDLAVSACILEPIVIRVDLNLLSQKVLDIDICDQYTLQGEAISLAILNDEPVPYGLEDAVGNMRTLQALRQSNESSAWIAP